LKCGENQFYAINEKENINKSAKGKKEIYEEEKPNE
jgi:hypothetical protein